MMILTSQRRRHSRWRMLFISMIFLGLVNHSELLPTGRLKDSEAPAISLAGRSRMRKSQDIGSPSELAWQAWLLLDTQSGAHSSLDSASLLRRITPKSVFIAPALTTCPDGFQADKMGRCVRNFNIDEKAHTSFLLQRLNVKFADSVPLAGFSSKDQKESSGPLQLNIPLLSNTDTQSTTGEHEEIRDSVEVPVVVPPQGGTHSDEKKEPQKAVVTVYEVKNDTETAEEGENMFFLGNTNASTSGTDVQDSSSKSDTVVPVAEFIDDSNRTEFSEVVDYKIPIALKTIFNASGIKKINMTVDQEFSESMSDATNATDDSPKLVLLLSPTKVPSNAQPPDVEDVENVELGDKDIPDPVIIHVSNVTTNISDKEMISVSVPESMMPPLKKLSEVPLLVVDKTENNTQDDGALEEHSPNTPQDTEILYDDEEEEEEDEDYLDTTDHPLYEESGEVEGDEILKHSEAGITIPVKNLERFHLERQQIPSSNATSKNETAKGEILSETLVRFNESTPTGEKDEVAAKISSEVSINGDFIQETTLLDVNTDKPKDNRKSSVKSNPTGVAEKEEDLKEESEPQKESNPQPEVVFSPQDVHGTVSTRLHGRKRTGQAQTEIQSTGKSDEMEAAPSSSETLLYDPVSRNQFREEDPITEIHTIDTQYSIKKDPSPEMIGSHKPSVSEVSSSVLKSLASESKPTQGYSDFPSFVRQSMRLYSEEANSIHNQDYKEGVPYRLDESLHSGTKSSMHIHQKPSYMFMPSWRSDRQQILAQQVQTTAMSPRQKHPPLFLHFWTHMPLVVDPSLSSSGQGPRGDVNGGQRYQNSKSLQASPPRRTNFYKDVSPPDLNISFGQKLRTLIGG